MLTAQNIARVLKVPVAFLYAVEDEVATLIRQHGNATSAQETRK